MGHDTLKMDQDSSKIAIVESTWELLGAITVTIGDNLSDLVDFLARPGPNLALGRLPEPPERPTL